MDVGTIEEKLDRLATLRAKLVKIDDDRLAKHEKILKPIQYKLNNADNIAEELAAPLKEKAAALEAVIKEAVIEHGKSVKASMLHAVLYSAREKWDSAILEGMIAFHPEIAKARSYGEPSVQFRKVE